MNLLILTEWFGLVVRNFKLVTHNINLNIHEVK